VSPGVEIVGAVASPARRRGSYKDVVEKIEVD
jgi:hypothetical protein